MRDEKQGSFEDEKDWKSYEDQATLLVKDIPVAVVA